MCIPPSVFICLSVSVSVCLLLFAFSFPTRRQHSRSCLLLIEVHHQTDEIFREKQEDHKNVLFVFFPIKMLFALFCFDLPLTMKNIDQINELLCYYNNMLITTPFCFILI